MKKYLVVLFLLSLVATRGWPITGNTIEPGIFPSGIISATTVPDNSITPVKLATDNTSPSATTYYRGDGKWFTPSGAGTVTEVTGDSMIDVATGTTTPALSINDNSIPTGKITDNTIVDADINSAAAINASKIGGGGVSTAEFDYLGTLTSNVQDQIDAKQTAAADLDTLVNSGANKVFYADNDGVLQPLAVGAEGTALCFHGLDAAPTPCTVSATPGGSDTHVQIADNGVFRGTADAVIGSDNVLRLGKEMVGPGFQTTAPIGTRYIGALNNGNLDNAYLAPGRCWNDNTINSWKCRNNDNTITYIADSMVKTLPIVIKSPVLTDDFPVIALPSNIQLVEIISFLTGSDNVVGQLQDCNQNIDNCVNTQSVDGVFATGLDAITTFDGAGGGVVPMDHWLYWKTTSVGGTPTFLTLTVKYYEY